jgi:hypothetical protein
MMMTLEGVRRMILVWLMTVAMVLLIVVIAWSALVETAPGDQAGPANGSGPARAAARPETLEGLLVRQLIDDEISRVQYRRAMQRLAETDADRHPLTVPPEN